MVLVGALLVMIFMLSACGGTDSVVKINDDGVETEIQVKLPRTVKKILADAEIQLGENDIVEPAEGSKLQVGETISITREHRVKLTVAGETKEVKIVGGTVEDLLKQEGISLGEDQTTSKPADEVLTEGMEIEVVNKLQISLNVDGKTEKKSVGATTVEGALKEFGITLGEEDRVEPEKTKAVSDGMEITVKRVKTEEVTVTEPIEYETSYEYSDAYLVGVEVVSREGTPGEREVTYKITTVDGEEESREVLKETIITEPIFAIVILGSYEEPEYEDPGTSYDEVYEVSREDFPNCSGDGHGYYVVVYSDGTEEVVEY